jgi:lysophospholipase
VAEFICSKGLAFAAFDLRGHGRSGPARGDVENLQALVLDVLYVVNHAQRILGFCSNRSDFFFGILGHSFGGLLVTYAASILADSCPPIFLSSPCYRLKARPPVWKRRAAHVLPRFVPQVRVPLEIDSSKISKNAENNAAYEADDLNLKEVSVRYGKVFLDSLNEGNIRLAVGQIRAPVTVCFGRDDDLVDAAKTEELSQLFASESLIVRGLEGAGHEVFNELPEHRAQAFSCLDEWLINNGVST